MYLNKEELRKIAYMKYPVGTKFVPAHCDKGDKEFCIVTKDTHFEFLEDDLIAAVGISCFKIPEIAGEKYGNTDSNRCVYDASRDQWARILIDQLFVFNLWYRPGDEKDFEEVEIVAVSYKEALVKIGYYKESQKRIYFKTELIMTLNS